MSKLKILSSLFITLGLGISSILNALPENLETFIDFENFSGEGTDFTLGNPPFTIRVINFTLETVENPSLARSGTKALVLGREETLEDSAEITAFCHPPELLRLKSIKAHIDAP